MHVDIYISFMRAKFQMAALSNKRAVAVPSTTDIGEFWKIFPRNIWELSVVLAQFQIDSRKTSFYIKTIFCADFCPW
ncbi:MAG: hypothetical protein AB2705_21195, partial [Candidatus Thiodiazotropha sp.]